MQMKFLLNRMIILVVLNLCKIVKFAVDAHEHTEFSARKALQISCDMNASLSEKTSSQSSKAVSYIDDLENSKQDFNILSAISKSIEEWRSSKRKKSLSKLKSKPNHSRKRRDEESVCYQSFGCFRDEGAFDYLDTLPASPESIATSFILFTRKNAIDGQLLDYDNSTTLLASNFNSSNKVKIIIHGFGSSGKRPWVLKMTEALLSMDDFNVINVDWENGSRMPNYVQAAANTQLIGKQIAKLIRMINFVTKLNPSQYHLIGFSLGAHVAGFTGMEIHNISRITGLDPASPLFEGYPASVRLDPTDADFVDVIHSNGDSFIRGGLGSYAPMGHVDFYPNGGRVQVGCNSVFMGAITDIIYGKWNSLCNHRRAFRFFIDSVVRTCTFRAFACDTYEDYIKGHCFTCGLNGSKCSNMGYFAINSNGRGNMYLVTRDKEPFCVNQFRIQIDSSKDGQSVTWGKVDVQLLSSNGLNETFVLTQESDEMKEGAKIQALIVAHPKLINITEVIVTYTKYKGWIYNGKNEWNIDRIEVLDSMGKIKSYCNPGTKLFNSVILRLPLNMGNCTVVSSYLAVGHAAEPNSSLVSTAYSTETLYHLTSSLPSNFPNHLLPTRDSSSTSIMPYYEQPHVQSVTGTYPGYALESKFFEEISVPPFVKSNENDNEANTNSEDPGSILFKLFNFEKMESSKQINLTKADKQFVENQIANQASQMNNKNYLQTQRKLSASLPQISSLSRENILPQLKTEQRQQQQKESQPIPEDKLDNSMLRSGNFNVKNQSPPQVSQTTNIRQREARKQKWLSTHQQTTFVSQLRNDSTPSSQFQFEFAVTRQNLLIARVQISKNLLFKNFITHLLPLILIELNSNELDVNDSSFNSTSSLSNNVPISQWSSFYHLCNQTAQILMRFWNQKIFFIQNLTSFLPHLILKSRF